MKRLTADIHTHTIVSGHAYGTIRENVHAAKEAGLELLGIAEHAPGVPGTCDPFYFWNMQAVPREIEGVRLILGSEINVLNDGTLSLEQRFVDRLDYGIAGIHITCYTDEGREKNTDNLISCMKNSKVRFVSHPDDDRTPLDYKRLAEAAAAYGVALEVNNSSLRAGRTRLNCVANLTEMLKRCREYGVPVIVSSDAHDPSEVGKFPLAERFLEEQAFPDDLILTNDARKVLDFISG